MYHSTRGLNKVHASEAIIKGLAEDKGLYVLDEISKLELKKEDTKLSYQEICKKVFRVFLDDFTDEEIDEVVAVYSKDNFPYGFTSYRGTTDYCFLYLTLGPTFAFKDMALQVLPKLIEISKRKHGNTKKTVVLTATSGDTGSAAMSGFSKNDKTKIVVLYPNNGCSELQEAQMLSFIGENAKALAVNGNFDDCQRMVKKIFNEYHNDNIDLVSANSINIGRLIPQVAYYYASYLKLVDDDLILFGEKINVVVPTGNFGNILACITASKMGLPINKIICASNENNILTDFFTTGVYDVNRSFKQTNSPAMDILISSNLERFLYLLYKDTNKIKEIEEKLENTKKFEIPVSDIESKFPNLIAGYATEDETIEAIKKSYKLNKILIDPHTAVGFKVLCDNKNLDNCFTVVVSTASPYKFSSTICKALGLEEGSELDRINEIYKKTGVKVDPRIYEYLKNTNKKTVVDYDKLYDTVTGILDYE